MWCKLENTVLGVNSLESLCRVLNNSERRCMTCSQRKYCYYADRNEFSSLPIFGGSDMRGTEGVFSWDEKNQLVSGHLAGTWKIVPRKNGR